MSEGYVKVLEGELLDKLRWSLNWHSHLSAAVATAAPWEGQSSRDSSWGHFRLYIDSCTTEACQTLRLAEANCKLEHLNWSTAGLREEVSASKDSVEAIGAQRNLSTQG